MQTITFTAPSGGELRQQMLDFLGITAAPVVMQEQPVYSAETIAAVKRVKEEIADLKSRGKVAKKITPVLPPTQEQAAPEPQGSRAPEPVPEKMGTTPSSAREDVPEEFVTQEVVTPPKEALELKEKVIDLLQEAFRAGKVKQVRSVLGTYGNGAKSFREIEITAFPEIEKALMRGALN